MAESATRGPSGREAWNAREIARRNVAAGTPLNPLMKTAATARELAHGAGARKAERKG